MPAVAVVDVGSHAVRLSVVKLNPLGVAIETAFHRWPLRLGTDSYASGKIGAQRAGAVTGVFREIKEELTALDVDAYRAVATAAMRDARNAPQLVARIEKSTGIHLEVISGEEEGVLARDALIRALGSVPDDTLLLDLGGGSLELNSGDGRFAGSVPLGTVRMTARHPRLIGKMKPHQVQSVLCNIEQQLQASVNPWKAPLCIGTGGNLDALARLVPAPRAFHPTIDVTKLETNAEAMAAMSASERVKRLHVRPDRADVIVAAALVIAAVARTFRVQRLVVPGAGLRETILRNLAASLETPAELGRRLARGLDEEQRAMLRAAERLFALLAPVHRLWHPAYAVVQATIVLSATPETLANPPVLALALQRLERAGLDQRCTRAAASAAKLVHRPNATVCDGLSWEDRHAVYLSAGLTRLARDLVRQDARELAIDLTQVPLQLRAGLPKALRKRRVRFLESTLGVELRVR